MQRYIYSIIDQKTSFCYVDTREYDLQQKMDLEIKMREGTAKLLAACKHMNQSLEAAKSLLTSDLRLSEFKNELNRRKSAHRNNNNNHHHNKLKADSVKAKASVSDIRIPLIWKDTDYFKNKGDSRRFAVFCVLKIGTEIFDTVMINIDRNMTDICFDDTFHFNHVQPDFIFELFIYARVLHDDLSMASTPKKITYKISNSLSRSLGRKMAHCKDDFDPETGPKFYLIARASLNLKDSADSTKTHDLVVEEELDKNLQLPLFGHFCCRLAVQPECIMKDYLSGILKFTSPQTELFWCVLSKFKMNLWHMKTELMNEPAYVKHTSSKRPPDLIIPIDSHTRIIQTANNMINIIKPDKTELTFECLNEQHKEWFKCLQKVKEDFIAWEPIAEYNMELAPVEHHRSQYLFLDRPSGSLYNETPIQDFKRHSKSFSHVGPSNIYNLSAK